MSSLWEFPTNHLGTSSAFCVAHLECVSKKYEKFAVAGKRTAAARRRTRLHARVPAGKRERPRRAREADRTARFDFKKGSQL